MAVALVRPVGVEVLAARRSPEALKPEALAALALAS
jgi:hypothetical protein